MTKNESQSPNPIPQSLPSDISIPMPSDMGTVKDGTTAGQSGAQTAKNVLRALETAQPKEGKKDGKK